jgi:hypothetical protein
MSNTRWQAPTRGLLITAGLALAVSASAGKPPDCWMTGGGSIFDSDGSVEYTGRTTHGMILHCDTRNPNNLQINWEGNTFHLTDLASAACPDTAGITPNPPDAEFDTFIGFGEGRLNGDPGATIVFTFTDAGEPGTADTAEITIFDPDGWQVLSIAGTLTFGNHQAHSN